MTFDGNPLHYWTFIRFFENSVERVTKDNVSRLTLIAAVLYKKSQEGCAVLCSDGA